MTPTQAAADKAKELIEKFLFQIRGKCISDSAAEVAATQCTLVCINEIILAMNPNNFAEIQQWREVSKQFISK